ncbi:MAG: hypothetical protein ACMXYA_01020 [Candidatus Woesearchaeota archaeon]
MQYKSQTAVEYLLILAVVLLIVGVFASLSMDFSQFERSTELEQTQLRLESVAVLAYKVDSDEIIFEVQNTKDYSIRITEVQVSGIVCNAENTDILPLLLRVEQVARVVCEENFENITQVPTFAFEYEVPSQNQVRQTANFVQVNKPPFFTNIPRIELEEFSGLHEDVLQLQDYVVDLDGDEIQFVFVNQSNSNSANCNISPTGSVSCYANISGMSEVFVNASDGEFTATSSFFVNIYS